MSFENLIFIDVLEQASNELSNNSCNDFDVTVTDENREELCAFINEYARDDAQATSLLNQMRKGRVYFQDFCVMNMLIRKLKAQNV
jgi:hypothetical protein